MWGNTFGWFLALVMLGSLIFGLHQVNEISRISEPTSFGLDPANLGVVELPVAPSRLVSMDQNIDAKSLYRSAIDDYLNNRDTYDRFSRSKDSSDAGMLKGLKNLLDATHATSAKIFADDPGEIVTYKEKPGLEAIATLGHLSARAALLAQTDHLEIAPKYFEAEFALGVKLFEERLTVDELSRGMELMAESSAGMERLLQRSDQSARAQEFRTFDDGRKQYYNDHVLPMLKVLQSIDTNVVGEHAGDIIYFARHCQERMYRVEAIFAMGRMRFFAGENGRIGNQRGAMAELRKLAEDPDPVIRRAATEARDLTIEQYRFLK
jgi:hypothetical protein